MKSKQKKLCLQLLKGAYLMKRPNGKMEPGYGIYTGNKLIQGWVDQAVVRSLWNYLKEDHKHRYTLNLNVVRQMDGRMWLKKKYKNMKSNETVNQK